MKVPLVFAEVHTPLFLNNTNWGNKLQPNMGTKGKLEMVYDRENKELLVSCGDAIAIVPTSNVVSMTPAKDAIKAEPKPIVYEPEMAKPGTKANLDSQAGTPHDHVFAGKGKGKTRD